MTVFLDSIIKEYNDICREAHGDDSSGTIAEIRKVERAVTNPELHPTPEIKSFFKAIKSSYKTPFKVCFLGNDELVVLFFNVFLKDTPIPLHRDVISKGMTVKYSQSYFTVACFGKNGSAAVDLFRKNSIRGVRSLEVFSPSEILMDFEFHKRSSRSEVNLKEFDMVVLFLNLGDSVDTDRLKKLLNRKPSLVVINHSNENDEFLGYFTMIKNKLSQDLNASQIVDINISSMCAEISLHDRLHLLGLLGNISRGICSGHSFSYDLDMVCALRDSVFHAKGARGKKIAEISDYLYRISQDARLHRDINTLNDVLKTVSIVFTHYDHLSRHYEKLYTMYRSESKKLIEGIASLNAEYGREMSEGISAGVKHYIDSIIRSMVDNMDPTQTTIPSRRSGFLFSKTAVFDTFTINSSAIFRETEDRQSLFSRKHRALISRIKGLFARTLSRIDALMKPMYAALEEWIKDGHYLVLQTKPHFVNMNMFFDLEEFNLNVVPLLTQVCSESLEALTSNMQLELNELGVWVNSTQKLMLECVIGRIESQLKSNFALASSGNLDSVRCVDRNLIMSFVVDLLPSNVSALLHAHALDASGLLPMLSAPSTSDHTPFPAYDSYHSHTVVDGLYTASSCDASRLVESLERARADNISVIRGKLDSAIHCRKLLNKTIRELKISVNNLSRGTTAV